MGRNSQNSSLIPKHAQTQQQNGTSKAVRGVGKVCVIGKSTNGFYGTQR